MIRSFCWGADAFVAIGEGVILDHEVEQMGRPQLGCGIERLAIESLLDRSKDAGQRLAVVLPEQRGGFTAMGKVAAQGVDGPLGLRQSQGLRQAIRFCECGREPILVVGEQPAPGAAVALHHLQHRLPFIAHQAPGAEGAGHQGESILQIAKAPFLEAALVERVALDQMLAQHLGSPNPELGAAR
jgi:hypothetical protein